MSPNRQRARPTRNPTTTDASGRALTEHSGTFPPHFPAERSDAAQGSWYIANKVAAPAQVRPLGRPKMSVEQRMDRRAVDGAGIVPVRWDCIRFVRPKRRVGFFMPEPVRDDTDRLFSCPIPGHF